MIHIAMCDDELNELANLVDLMSRYRKTQMTEMRFYTFQNGFALLDAIEGGIHFDIALLDVIMPSINGMEVAKKIRQTDKQMAIVFLTSSPEFAVESYTVEASNYVLKPVWQEKLFSVIDSVLQSRNGVSQPSLLVRDRDGGRIRLQLAKLSYCEASGRGVDFHLDDGRLFQGQSTFAQMCDALACYSQFAQCHRSYIVNLAHIERLTKKEIILISEKVVPISKNYYSEVSEKFLSNLVSETFHEGDK